MKKVLWSFPDIIQSIIKEGVENTREILQSQIKLARISFLEELKKASQIDLIRQRLAAKYGEQYVEERYLVNTLEKILISHFKNYVNKYRRRFSISIYRNGELLFTLRGEEQDMLMYYFQLQIQYYLLKISNNEVIYRTYDK